MNIKDISEGNIDKKLSVGYGFGLLPGRVRGVLVVILSTASNFISSIMVGVYALGAALILYLLNLNLRKRKALTFLFVTVFVFMVLGNLLFSPAHYEDGALGIGTFNYSFGIITISDDGLNRGVMAGLRRFTMIVIGIAYLNSTKNEYFSLYYFASLISKKWALVSIRLFQILVHDYKQTYTYIKSQGMKIKITTPIESVKTMWTIASVAMSKLFTVHINQVEYMGEAIVGQQKNTKSKNTIGGMIVDHVEIIDTNESEKKSISLQHSDTIKIEKGEVSLRVGQSNFWNNILKAVCGIVPGERGLGSKHWVGQVQIGNTIFKSDDNYLDKISGKIRWIGQISENNIVGLTVGHNILIEQGQNKLHNESIIKQLGLVGLLDKDVQALSGGETVRAILAGVLAGNADVLVLESPSQQLDREGMEDFKELLLNIENMSDPPAIFILDPAVQEFLPYCDSVHYASVKDTGSYENEYTVTKVAGDERFEFMIDQGDLPTPNSDNVRKKSLTIQNTKNVKVSLSDKLKRRGKELLLDKIDLDVRRNESLGLIGPNGVGKTTLGLRLLGIKIGHTYSGPQSDIRDISFQNPFNSFLKRGITDDIREKARLKNLIPDKHVVEITKALDKYGISPHGNPFKLSFSEAKVLSCLQAVAGSDVVFLDEPTASLTWDERRKLKKDIGLTRDTNKTIIIATHDPLLWDGLDRIVNISEDGSYDVLNGMVEEIGNHQINTSYGRFEMYVFRDNINRDPIVCCLSNDKVDRNNLDIRIQYGCIYGTVFSSNECDCDIQVENALEMISDNGGLFIYFPNEEGRGLGWSEKIKRMKTLDDTDYDTKEYVKQLSTDRVADYRPLDFVPSILSHMDCVDSKRTAVTSNATKVLKLASLSAVNNYKELSAKVDPLTDVAMAERQVSGVELGRI